MTTREKLFDDPLLGPGAPKTPSPAPKSTPVTPSTQKVEDDPLLGLLTAPTSKPSTHVATNSAAISSPRTEEILQTIDVDKVKLKVAKEKKTDTKASAVVPDESPSADTAAKDSRLGLGVDLFGNMSSAKTVKVSVFDDVLSATQRSTDGVSGLFSASSANPAEEVVRPTVINPNASKFRVAYEADDAQIEDLKVGKLVEKEELDFGLFGKASGALRSGHEGRDILEKSSAGIMSTNKEEFDVNLSAEYLNELDSATSGKDLSVRPQMPVSSFEFKTAAPAAQPSSIDLSSLNLDDYIAQQTAGKSSGGLFD